METSVAWTPERVETLKNMWSEGQSASQIAGELGGVTRNAVIGKVNRLGLSNRGSTTAKEKKPTHLKENKKNQKIHKELLNTNVTSTHLKKAKNSLDKEKTSPEPTKKDPGKQSFQSINKSIIFTANQPLPPQPSTSEISEETLKNVKSLEKKSKKLSLMELTERTCKWPIGDPATENFWFCGHTAEQGKPYCETHIEIAFQPVTSRRERRTR